MKLNNRTLKILCIAEGIFLLFCLCITVKIKTNDPPPPQTFPHIWMRSRLRSGLRGKRLF